MSFYVPERQRTIWARFQATHRPLLGILAIPFLLLSTPSQAIDIDDALFRQLATIVVAEATPGQTVELADFTTKAQTAINFMRPSGQLQGPYAANVASWSPTIAEHFAAYLWQVYQSDLNNLGANWIDRVINHLQSIDSKVVQLSWGVLIDGVSHPFDSVAVFDPAGNLLFDTILIHTLTGIAAQPAVATDRLQQARVASTDTETVSGSYKVEGTLGGSRTLSYQVTSKAEVSPYITAATNDAAMTMTASVSNRSTSTSGLFPPSADPRVYFGTGGQYKLINTDAAKTPFKSPIRVSPDVFQDGVYQVSGNDLGSGTTFNLSFGVSVSAKGVGGSVGIEIPGPGPLILVGSSNSASELFLGNVLYSDNAGLRYRGAFKNGGNFKLTNFLIRTGDSAGETGNISASIPVYMAHEGIGILKLTGQSAGTLSPRATYVRGDHLKQPTYTVKADRETVKMGEDVTVTVEIRNNSSAVDIKDGSVALDAGTLNGVLTPKSATVVSFGTIGTNRSQSVTFVLTAVRAGQITFQADVEGRWGSPVPPQVTFDRKISLDDPIDVGEGNGNESKGQLESPQQNSFESGIGLIRGWVCDAEVLEIQIDDRERQRLAYGTNRGDTREVCGDVDNGFGYTVNWNGYGNGAHTLRLFIDGEESSRVNFTVTTLGVDFLQDVSGQYTLANFPQTGRDVVVRWSEPHQNFVIMGASSSQTIPFNSRVLAVTPQATSPAQLESPQQNSFQSGIGLIRGWVCDAEALEIQIDDRERQRVAYGTNRGDTREVCGDVDNGFGYTVNWNGYGNGAHTLRLFIDGEESSRVNFTVTTLGVDFLRDVSGQYTLANFPQTGRDVVVRWSEPHQNFVITDYR